MTIKQRIAYIRLSEKIERKPEYAEHLGVSIVNGRRNLEAINRQKRIKK